MRDSSATGLNECKHIFNQLIKCLRILFVKFGFEVMKIAFVHGPGDVTRNKTIISELKISILYTFSVTLHNA